MNTDVKAGEQARAFRRLHEGDGPLLLANAWSAASARIAEAAGAAAIGTTSFGMALDHGRPDGRLPFETALAVVAEIVAAVAVPVSFDLEAGRGETPAAVRASMAAAIDAGVAGVNIEDSVPGRPGALFDAEAQAERLAAARAAADAAGVDVFVNARCDVFFGADLPAGRRRASAYRDGGADGLFVPGLVDIPTIEAVVAGIGPLPLNVMVGPGLPALTDLAAAGVRRVSQGGLSFLAAAGALHAMTVAYLGGELLPPMDVAGAGFGLLPTLARDR